MIKYVTLDVSDFKLFEKNIYVDSKNYAYLVEFDEYYGTISIYMLTKIPGKKVFLGDCRIEDWKKALENKGVVELEKTIG